jgi:hypothetical protein
MSIRGIRICSSRVMWGHVRSPCYNIYVNRWDVFFTINTAVSATATENIMRKSGGSKSYILYAARGSQKIAFFVGPHWLDFSNHGAIGFVFQTVEYAYLCPFWPLRPPAWMYIEWTFRECTKLCTAAKNRIEDHTSMLAFPRAYLQDLALEAPIFSY